MVLLVVVVGIGDAVGLETIVVIKLRHCFSGHRLYPRFTNLEPSGCNYSNSFVVNINVVI